MNLPTVAIPIMLIRSRKIRQITGYLAIVASLLGCLQQCHAYCYLGSCRVADREVATCECCKCCCHKCQQCKTTPRQESSDDLTLASHHQMPCQSASWCCQTPEPLTISSDTTEVARKLLASSDLIAIDTIQCDLSAHAPTAAFDVSYRECESLSAAIVCVQLCRFRI